MAKNSNIDWTDHTWNPWQGCKKVSPGCANCYMFRDKKRYGQDPTKVVRSKPGTFNKPLTWKESAKVFVCSWSDFFIEDADPWRDEAWEIMNKTPHLTYLLLTKRPENIIDRLPDKYWPMKNVWIGATAENHEQAYLRIYHLLQVPVSAYAGRFLSVEPMIGPVDLVEAVGINLLNLDMMDSGDDGIDWVICGGESGPKARELDPEWALEILQQSKKAKVPFFMKQMSGTTKEKREAIPENLMVREFPRGL